MTVFLKRGEIDVDLKEVSERSAAIRAAYHALEREYHGSEWSVEEDALAFLTDAGLVGRLTMSHEGRWPSDEEGKLPSKIGECVWWLAVLTDRTGLDFADCVQQFLADTEQALK